MKTEHAADKAQWRHQASVLEENIAVAKTLKEWTPELLSRLFDAECSPEEGINRICALHNAAIADAIAAARQPLVDALQLCVNTLRDKRIGTVDYMEGSRIYSDFKIAADKGDVALANFTRSSGNREARQNVLG